MPIQLKNIVPQPLADKNLTASEIWNQECTFSDGEYIHVHAPSGTGKSTMLHILYGLRRDFTGALFIDTIKMPETPASVSSLRKNALSIVFQDMRLFPELKGLENIAVKNALTDHESDENMREMMEQLGVLHLEHKKAKTMSLGEQQRIAIIRALVQPFQWLLLDEPFSHLDENNIKKAQAMMLKYCQKNAAGLIIATLGEQYGMQFHRNLNL